MLNRKMRIAGISLALSTGHNEFYNRFVIFFKRSRLRRRARHRQSRRRKQKKNRVRNGAADRCSVYIQRRQYPHYAAGQYMEGDAGCG